jgi:hypothetical protein
MAERFGWTPRQVDELSPEQADWLIAIGVTIDKIKAGGS